MMAFRVLRLALPLAAFAVSLSVILPVSAQSVPITSETFTAGTTGALARLCGASAQDPAYAAAVHFCHGLLVGTGQTSDSIHKRQGTKPSYCLPEPSPSLDQVAASFVAWAAANPQLAGTRAADGLLRFAAVQYPCAGRTARR
ncbi:MAG: Rap1a/Tai family immunity protein [Roseomonas sp.]